MNRYSGAYSGFNFEFGIAIQIKYISEIRAMEYKAIYIGGFRLIFGDLDQMPEGVEVREELSSRSDVLQLLEEAGKRKQGTIGISGKWRRNLRVIRRSVHFVRAAGGAVYNPNDELLLIHRMGKWDLPKGKKEDNESKRECAVREVQEECNVFGLIIMEKLPTTYHVYTENGEWVLKRSSWYRMNCSVWNDAKPQQEEDIDEVKWVKPRNLDIPNLDTYATIRDLLRQL